MGTVPAAPARRIQWRRRDHVASEDAVLEPAPGGAGTGIAWHLGGVVNGVLPDERPYSIRYRVRCDASWATRDAEVECRFGTAAAVRTVLERDPGTGRWSRDGAPQPQVSGCIDVDLGFSPATNTLPIRRLALPVGGEAAVRAAWLRFPELELVPLEQLYRRLAPERYLYESAGGRFRAELEVDGWGLVTRYGDYWLALGPEPAA